MGLYDHLQDIRWLWVQNLATKMPRAAFEILAEGMNLVEGAVDFVRTKLNVVDAEGVYLDARAAMWGVSRQGLGDDDFRKVIIAEASSLFGSGDPGIVIRLIRQLIGDGPTIQVVEKKFHTFLVYIGFNNDIPPATATLLGQVLDDVPALTINGTLVVVDDVVCCFSSIHGAVPITGGFDSSHGVVDSPAGFAHAIGL